jgi:hypothetical protein
MIVGSWGQGTDLVSTVTAMIPYVHPCQRYGQEAGMAKAIHMMVRVLDERRSVEFYDRAFGLKIADRFDFDDFTLSICATPRTTSRSS